MSAQKVHGIENYVFDYLVSKGVPMMVNLKTKRLVGKLIVTKEGKFYRISGKVIARSMLNQLHNVADFKF